jgi:lambda family phage tail tape measure protein
MATTKANIDVRVTGQQQLDRLQGSMLKVNDVFSKFKSALAGAAFSGIAVSAMRLADTVQDLADVTGIATAEVLAFQQAVQFGGGTVEKANKGLLEFFQTVSEAAGGSAKAQAAFASLGISLNDLANLSEKALFDRAAGALAQMEPSAQKAALQAEVLGKAFRNVTINPAFVQNLQAAGAQAQKTADSIARAAELNEQWERSIFKVQLAFLEAFTPLINNLAKILDMIPQLVTAFKILAAVIAVALGLTAFRAVVGVVGMIARGVTLLIKNFGSLGTFIRGLGTGSTQALGKLRDMVTAITAPLLALVAYFGLFTGEEKKATDETQANTAATEANRAAQESAARAQREVTSAIAEKTRQLQAQVAAFRDQNAQNIDNINLENQLIGKSKEYSDTIKAQEEVMRRSAAEVDRLREAKAALSVEERKLGLGAEYDKQIAKIKELTDAELSRLQKVISNSSKLQAAESLRQFGLSQEIDLQKQLNQILDQTAKIGLTELESKYQDISIAARESARAAIAAEAARRGLDTLPMADQEEYYRRAAAGMDRLRTATKNLHDQSRTFGAGWRKAFNEYVDAATNAAARAERIFSKFVTGIEDALVDFAKTGKLNWRSFVADMAEELLRSQIRETLATLGQSLGLGKLFGAGSGSAPGSSASNPMYVTMVGAGGGSGDALGDFISKLGGGSRAPSTTSGGGVGGGGTLDNILNIGKSILGGGGNLLSTIGSGIKSIFGGFFADGGRIPGGKFGVVGERGPELIGGPANITPMGGGAMTVTYNIQAVDAASFQSLVARDPGFIHAVAEMGRSRLPGNRK